MKVLFKNAKIIDGTNAPEFFGDVLTLDDKIIAVGDKIEADGVYKIIDCEGLYVLPGFIDAHSHNDFFALRDNAEKYFAPFVKQGVTSQIVGHCGFSPFGVAAGSAHIDKVGGGLFKTDNPSSFVDFVNRCKGRLYLNLVPLIGHGTVRIGQSGYDSASLTEDKLEAMLNHVDEAMQNGAWGGSLGLMYEPGLYAKRSELVAFAKRIARHGGILTAHARAYSKIALGYRLLFSKPHMILALEEFASIAKEAGAKAQYSHLICIGKASFSCAKKILKKIHQYKKDGLDIEYDNYAFCFGATVLTVILPAWYMEKSKEERRDKKIVKKLRTMINLTKMVLGLKFSDFVVAYLGEGEELKKMEGKNIEQLASENGVSGFEMYIRLIELSDGKGRVIVHKYNNDRIIKDLVNDEHSIFMTDAWVENEGIQNEAAFSGMTEFIKMASEGIVPLEKAVYKMTGKTAARYGIEDRGVIREGAVCDIVVMDVGEAAARHVMIGGEFVIEDGEFLGERAGKVLLKK